MVKIKLSVFIHDISGTQDQIYLRFLLLVRLLELLQNYVKKILKTPFPPLWLIIFGFGYATVNEARFMIFNRVMSAAKERKKIILIAR